MTSLFPDYRPSWENDDHRLLRKHITNREAPMLTFDDIAARSQATRAEALELFDSLDPVPVEFMIGTWRGDEIATGHPLGGSLAATGWYGKQFVDAAPCTPCCSTPPIAARSSP
jgi:hypothetical protein